MNIEVSTLQNTQNFNNSTSKNSNNSSSENFADELKELKKNEKEVDNTAKTTEEKENLQAVKDEKPVIAKEQKSGDIDIAIQGLNSVVKELNQADDKENNLLKKNVLLTDNDVEDEALINNDFNIQDNKDKLPQMNLNMNFGGDGQPFASFMNNNTEQNNNNGLSNNVKDLEEEAAILSTMSENLAMVNKVTQSVEPTERTVIKDNKIEKVDTTTNIVTETIIKYDTVIMNEADVELFVNLVENGSVDLSSITSQNVEKSVQVSKTLADMLAKAIEDNKPVRIEFDNGISVIIKISRDGKISADFLPSTQIAEAYLRENLPILKQRFDEQNLEYDELNQRERRDRDKDNQQKKDHENE